MPVLDIDLSEVRWFDWAEDPYPLYRALRDRCPLFRDADNQMWIVTRYEDIHAILRDYRRFASTPTYVVEGRAPRISPLREEDPPRHTLLRRVIMPMFTPKEMHQREPYFRRLARELLDRAEERSEEPGAPVVEVSSQLGTRLPGRVVCDLLGLPIASHERFREITEERLAIQAVQLGRIAPRDDLRSIQEVRAEQWEIVEPIVRARQVEPEHDAITLLVSAQDELGPQEIPDVLLIDMLLHLLTGGFHTTQHLIEMLLDQLAGAPELWAQLHADRSLVPVAIEEMLRFDAPVQALRRRALEPVVMHGVEIQKGDSVAIVYGAGNRDERIFDDPDRYLLDRGPSRHLAFSAGIHYCPGSPAARFEVRELLDEMLDRYESIERVAPSIRRLPPPDQRSVESMRGFDRVEIRLHRVAA